MSEAVQTVERTKPVVRDDRKPKKQPPYNVVLLDDDDHTYEYVIQMLGKLFRHGLEKAFLMACEVDVTGRVILLTSAGSMTAIIEPAEDE